MPTTIVNGDVAIVKIACVAADQIGLNVCGMQLSSVLGAPSYEDFVTAFNIIIGPHYAAAMAPTASYYGLSVQRVGPTFTQPFTLADPLPGTGMGNLEPRQACGIISKKGTVAGRPGRGRIYIPFLADGNTSPDAHLNAGGKLILDQIGTDLFTSYVVNTGGGNSVTIFPCIINNPVPTNNLISTFQTRTKLATQKRRGDYGKPNSPPW